MSTQPLIDRSQLSADVTNGLGPTTVGTNGQVLTVVGGTPTWTASSSASLAGLSDVALSSPTTSQVLTYNGTAWVNTTPSNSGTVTSITATGSTGLVVGGSPITSSGTLTFTLGAELQALSGLSFFGLVKRSAIATYVAATNADILSLIGYTPYNATNPSGYITANQNINLTGAVTGSGTTAIATTIAPTGVSAGSYNNVTVNAAGQVTAGGNVSYLTGNQNITATGDVSGSGATSLTLTLASVNSNVGTFGSSTTIPTFTVNAKGLITAASSVTLTRPIFTSVTQGEVPLSPGGTTAFLRADGTWSAPSTNAGTVTSVAAIGSTGLAVSGSPITGSGTLTFTLGTELQALSALSATGFVQRTGVATYSVANLTLGQITTALGFTPVANNFTINTTSPLIGGSSLVSSPMNLSILPFNGTQNGYVVANGVVTGVQYLRDDGTWDTPSGTGTVSSVQASGGTTGLAFSGGPITSSGTLTLSGTLAIANGGTGQTTASAAINALLPSQSGNSGNFLTTNGTSASWAAVVSGVSSFNTRTGAVTLQASDVTSALTYTPLQNNQIVSLSGDATGSSPGGGSNTIPVTLATVNSNVGTYGTSAQVPTITVNAKGLVTAVTSTSISPNAIGAATSNGSNATGTWAINITGNAATATTATTSSNGGVTSVTAGTGVSVSPTTGAVVVTNTGVTSLTGTSSVITVSASTGAVTLNISSSYVGQTSITTLGTVSTGTWNGSTIAASYGGTGTNTPPTTGQILVGTGSSTYVPYTLASGTGISTTVGSGTLQINNTGVTSVIAGSGITVSGATGAVTISATGGGGAVTSVTGTSGQITASPTTGSVVLSFPAQVIIPTYPTGPNTATLQVGSGGTSITNNTEILMNCSTAGSNAYSNVIVSERNGSPVWQIADGYNYFSTGLAMYVYGAGNPFAVYTGSNSTPYFSIASTGNVTIAAPTSGIALSVAGQINGTVLNATSDARVKKNIRKIDNPVELVESLNGVKFDWTSDNMPSVGLIAQDVEKVLPELISHSEKRDQLSLNYNGIIGVLVEAVKEMNATIKSLKAEIEQLKGS